MPHRIFVLNGPNANRLGTRETHIYGTTTLADIEAMCRDAAGSDEVQIRQSNAEHQIIDWTHEAIDTADGLIINPAAFTFYSIAIVDAFKMFDGPSIELHISNLHTHGKMYHDSLVSPVVTAVMAGFGARGYPMAVKAIQIMLDDK
ncbi:MAG: 3-dehydroquinate dehydratase [Rhodobacteraceae bacterium]|nr:3-dehydroquinate dehydratase [Paracoccaceae bacterium]